MQVNLIEDDKETCDGACVRLLRVLNHADKVLFWDTESVTYVQVTGQGTNEQRRSLVQVCVSNKLTVLFHVGTWSTMFASYQTSDTRGCGWSISWLMCALGQICFQTDLSFLLPCVNGHAPTQL